MRQDALWGLREGRRTDREVVVWVHEAPLRGRDTRYYSGLLGIVAISASAIAQNLLGQVFLDIGH